jgi:uncharacterized phosphosugar-binding protein
MPRDSKEKAHNEGSELHRESVSPNGESSMFDKLIEGADKVIDEAARIGKAAMEPENRSKVVAGAAVGAVASIVVPVVGPILGALVGAGYVANREDKKTG